MSDMGLYSYFTWLTIIIVTVILGILNYFIEANGTLMLVFACALACIFLGAITRLILAFNRNDLDGAKGLISAYIGFFGAMFWIVVIDLFMVNSLGYNSYRDDFYYEYDTYYSSQYIKISFQEDQMQSQDTRVFSDLVRKRNKLMKESGYLSFGSWTIERGKINTNMVFVYVTPWLSKRFGR